MLAGMSRRLAVAIALAASLLCLATFLSARAEATNFSLFGGEGSIWQASDVLTTSNGQPTGGLCLTSGGAGSGAGINDASASFGSDAFDFAALAWVDNQQVHGVITNVPPDEAIFAPAVVAGVEARMKIRALSSSAIARTLVDLTNPSASPVTVTVSYATNMGSDGATQLKATSSGDTVVTAEDRWVITDDTVSPGLDPANTTVLYGPGDPPAPASTVSTTVFDCFGTQGVRGEFEVAIPAGGRAVFVWFQQLSPSSETAPTRASVFNTTLTPGSPLTEGMSADELAAVVNWQVVEDSDGDGVLDSADNCPDAANAGQEDNDEDGDGDACDSDDDNDTVADEVDNCASVANTSQDNNDADAFGDACDADDDNDGVADGVDNCQFGANATQRDSDQDGTGDACDDQFDSNAGKATGGGFLLTGAGKLHLAVSAKSDEAGLTGTCTSTLGGSKLKSLDVDGYFQSPTGDEVVLVGDALHDGAPTRYRIEVTDLGEPGSDDRFSIATDSGLTASGALAGGNIQVHRP